MGQWAKFKKKYKTGPPSHGLREPACLDRLDGMPGQCRMCLQGVRVVLNSWHRGCCQTLSTQPSKAVLTPCDSDRSCCLGSDGLPTRWRHPTQHAVVDLWPCWG